MPVGVVGAITPWNFPIAIPSWKLAPALVCGNTVVLKPAEDTPLLAERFVELLVEAGAAGRASSTSCTATATRRRGARRAPRRLDHHLHRLARDRASRVTQAAAPYLKHVHLELGGKNAILVMDDADLDLAVEGIVWSAFGTSGQRCTAASRVIVHEKVYDELRIAPRRGRREDAPRPRLGAVHRPRAGDQPQALDKIHSYTGSATARARRCSPAARSRARTAASTTGRRSSATSRSGCGSPRRRSSARRRRSSRCATSTRRSTPRTPIEYGLSSSIFTADVNRAFRAMRDLETGITYINAGTTGAEVHLPVRRHEGDRQRPPRGRARPRSTSSPSGSRCTSTTRASCSARRSTDPLPLRAGFAGTFRPGASVGSCFVRRGAREAVEHRARTRGRDRTSSTSRPVRCSAPRRRTLPLSKAAALPVARRSSRPPP